MATDSRTIRPRKSTEDRPGAGVAILTLFLGLGAVSCDPYDEIRDRLDPAEEARFDRGASAASPCWTCHDIMGTGSKVGPHLQGLMGRKIGGLEAYGYTDALRSRQGVWTRAALDAFLANPQAFAPGNRMVWPGIGDPGIRADLIYYLELASTPPSRDRRPE